jgi:hypothetical protein
VETPDGIEITGEIGERYEEVLTPSALELIVRLHRELADRRLELLLADSDNDNNWVCRRNPAIVQPLNAIGRHTPDGVPYLAPAIQLLYKAKNLRPKDVVDFNAVLAELRAVGDGLGVGLAGGLGARAARAATMNAPNRPMRCTCSSARRTTPSRPTTGRAIRTKRSTRRRLRFR